MFSWTLCVSVCDTLCLWVCLVVWKKRKKTCVWERAKKLWIASRGFSSERECFSPPPHRHPLLRSLSLSFSVSLPNTQSSRRSETDLKEEKKNQRAARQFASLCATHSDLGKVCGEWNWLYLLFKLGNSLSCGCTSANFYCWWTKHGKFFCTKPKEDVWRGLPGPKNDKTFCFVEEKLLQTW